MPRTKKAIITSEEFKPDRIAHKTRITDVRPGDIMCVSHYIKVRDLPDTRASMPVTSLDGDTGDFRVEGKVLIEKAKSADRYIEEIQITNTRAAEILVTSFNRPFTVCFTKDDGEVRVLRGRLIEQEYLMGRSKVEDLEQPEGKRIRQVNHRDIHYIIVDGVKYVTKR